MSRWTKQRKRKREADAAKRAEWGRNTDLLRDHINAILRDELKMPEAERMAFLVKAGFKERAAPHNESGEGNG